MRTYYDVLRLKRTCKPQEIRQAFLNLSKIYHPDKNSDSEAHKKFVEINEAYLTLSKEDSRRRYDESLQYQQYVGKNSFPNRYGTDRVVVDPYVLYRRKYEKEFRSSGVQQDHGINFIRLLWIWAFSIVTLTTGFVVETRRSIKRRNEYYRKVALAALKTKERAKTMSKEELLKMYRDGTYRGITVADLEKDSPPGPDGNPFPGLLTYGKRNSLVRMCVNKMSRIESMQFDVESKKIKCSRN